MCLLHYCAGIVFLLYCVREEGYGCLASMSTDRRWVLFRVKPKLHMHEHVAHLGTYTGGYARYTRVQNVGCTGNKWSQRSLFEA